MNCLTLKKSNCKNCYKCIRNCPVKAIRFSGNQAHIVGNECIMCGQCFVVCPQNAKQIVGETEKARVLIQSGDPVYVSLAPSFVANYEDVSVAAMREALMKLGFAGVEETAVGATIVKTEYERMLREEVRDVVITSCCHSINLLIQKYYPDMLGYLADVVSPMQAHCMDIKRRIPNAKTVFIGPCLAKKDEAEHYEGIVDAVLTFEELSQWLAAEGIEIRRGLDENEEKLRARFFPTTGGVLRTMTKNAPGFSYLAVDGVDNCIAALEDIRRGKVHKCFVEMSACVGSCVSGPVMEKRHRSPVRDFASVSARASRKEFDVEQPDLLTLKKNFSTIAHKLPMPSEAEIASVMRQMGKFGKAQELNCGTCGYNTCREKAIAILQGKAEMSMCLPFLKERAESFSDTIVKNLPNGLIVLNDKLEVQQINNAARRIMNLRYDVDVLGEPVVRLLDPTAFVTVLDTGRHIHDQRVYLAEYQRYVEQTIVYDNESHLLIGILRDVTEEQNAHEKKDRITAQTVEVADKVVEKQMRIVQEIASLLGETAAETKIALAKLKESIINE